MVNLYVSIKMDYLYIGSFADEGAALRWFAKNRHSYQDEDGKFGKPITVRPRRR